jgi:hypothetical protein
MYLTTKADLLPTAEAGSLCTRNLVTAPPIAVSSGRRR